MVTQRRKRQQINTPRQIKTGAGTVASDWGDPIF